MKVRKQKGGRHWYFTFGYTDPFTRKYKTKWINTGVPIERNTKRAQDEAFAIGLKLREQFLEDVKNEYEGNIVRHRLKTTRSYNTIEEYARFWLEEIKGSVQDSTLNSYKVPLEKHILPKIGSINLIDLDQNDLKQFINLELADCDAKQKAIDKLIAESGDEDIKIASDKKPYYFSIRKHLRIIHMMLNYAISEGDITDNAVDKINPQVLKKIPKSDFEAHPYTKQEIAKLREVIKGSHLESAIIITSYLGLRREEVLGLRWQDIDFENQLIHIKNVCRLVGSVIEYTEKTKTRSSRAIVKMIDPLKEYLLELKEQQEKDRQICGIGFYETDLVCRWNDGHPIKPGNLTQGYSRLLEKAGLRHTRFHDLRHTVGTVILEETGDLKLASMALRHSDTRITADTYINHGDEIISKGWETLDTSNIE